MQNHQPPKLPSFQNDSELWALIVEGIESGEGTLMTPEEWQRLSDELHSPAMKKSSHLERSFIAAGESRSSGRPQSAYL